MKLLELKFPADCQKIQSAHSKCVNIFYFPIIRISFRYKSASKFSVQSKAELLETDLVVARDDKLVNVSTTFEVLEPVLEMTPGQGVTCGSLNCHKYASCEVQFGLEQLPNCICPDGFSG